MRAALFVCLVLVATNAVLAAEENPCTGEVLRCRDEICAGREVLENVCEFGDGIFTKSCSCGGLVESAVQQRPDALQPENSFDELFQPSEDGTAYEEGVALGETQEQESEMDCDHGTMEEDGEEEQQVDEEPPQGLPGLGGMGFTFRFSLPRRFGPGGEQQFQEPAQRVRFVRPAFDPFASIFGGGDASDDAFFAPRGESLLGSFLFGAPRPAMRQQFLLSAPSFVTRRVFYPDAASTMRLVNGDELDKSGVVSPLGEETSSEVKAERMATAAEVVRRWREAAGLQSNEDSAMKPMSSVRLAEAPRAVVPVAPDVAPEEEAGKREWYQGYHARRALYCIASIALCAAVIALNAAVLMCCTSACCHGLGEAETTEDFTVDPVAATTPLLVEYQVERVPKPGYEPTYEEEMIVVHHMAPMPREGKAM